jgi:hypothetical protein
MSPWMIAYPYGLRHPPRQPKAPAADADELVVVDARSGLERSSYS